MMITRLLKIALASVIVALPSVMLSQIQYRYWFDQPLTIESAVRGTVSEHLEIDVSGLSPNLHLLNFQIMNDDGSWGHHRHMCFLKSDFTPLPEARSVQVCIDGEPVQEYPASSLTEILTLDLPDISEGLHALHMVVLDSEGNRLSAGQAFFAKIENAKSEAQSVQVCIDGEPIQEYPASNLPDILTLDLPDLSEGLHALHMVVLDSEGNRLSAGQAFFAKIENVESLVTSLEVRIDGVSVLSQETEEGACQLMLDESELPTGLHDIEIVAHASDGSVSLTSRAFFYKPSDEAIRLAGYRYWVNNDNSTVEEVKLDPEADGLQLITLPYMPEMPFASHHFSCHPEADGSITMSPENTVRWLFSCDDGEHAVYREKPYADDRVKISVAAEDVEYLPKAMDSELGVTGIGDNHIKWYSFDAEIGTAFKCRTDCAVEMNLFDGAGQRLLDLDGSSTVSGAEYLFDEAGKYFLAVHDASMDASEVSMTYTLINRFDVVGCSPGCGVADETVFIDLRGNSFENATAFFLSRDGLEVAADAMVTLNSNNERLRFDLNGKNLPTGDYDIKAVFNNPDSGAEETVKIAGAFKLEELRRSELNVEIEYIPKKENPMHFAVVVTNKGNETLWGVPFNIAFEDSEKITKMTAVNFGIQVDPASEEKGVKTTFHTDNLLGTGKSGSFVPMLIDVLPPGEHRYNFRFTESGPTSFGVYGWVGVPWSRKDDSAATDGNLLTFQKICHEAGIADNDMPTLYVTARENLYYSYFGRYKRCVAKDLSVEVPKNSISDDAEGSDPLGRWIVLTKVIWPDDKDPGVTPADSNENGEQDATKEGGNGRPNADDGSGTTNNQESNATITVTESVDPNDIIGYTSPSGSEHIGIDVKTVDYKIEFENDPEFATAPASIIRIKSQLDPGKFDLTSFKPKAIRIGRNIQDWTSSSSKVKTLDMRPEIDAIAQVSYNLDTATGDLQIEFASLDPMTMEPTILTSQGILPVNDDGEEGIGEFIYEIGIGKAVESDALIENSATIIFDDNDPIETPVWVNVTDYNRPVSRVISVEPNADTGTARILVKAQDEGSGVWEYQLFVRETLKQGLDGGSASSWRMVGTVSTAAEFEMPVDRDIVYELCSIVRDKAGNYEDKILVPEMKISDFENVEDVWSGVGMPDNDDPGDDDAQFDLLGRRVSKYSKGIHVRKGEKVLIK